MTLICALGFAQAQAHEIVPLIVDIHPNADGQITVQIEANAEAMLAEIGSEHEDTADAPEAQKYDALRAADPQEVAQEFTQFAPNLLQAIDLQADGTPLELSFGGIEVPEIGDTSLARSSIFRLSATAPQNAETISWAIASTFGASILRVLDDQGEQAYSAYLGEGAQSEAISLAEPQARDLVSVIVDYIVIGFTHIIPKGLDHILFVIGIFLASTKWRPLLLQVSAFTVAHTITLALGILGWVNISPNIVEPLIALSIAYVCIENIFFKDATTWRPLVVFAFGLLHGLGFAGVLGEIGLPTSEFIVGLISFNVGVELGQLAVIAACFLAVGIWFGSKHFYRRLIVIPTSLVIGAIGLYWFVERAMFM